MSTLRQYIYSKAPGDRVVLRYIRGNKEYEISVELSKKY